MKENLITWKIKYSCDHDLSEYIKQYNSLVKFTFNRLIDGDAHSSSSINKLQKSMNHCDLMNSWFRSSAEYQAKGMLKASDGKPVIFGGKKLFSDRCQNKITREEFLKKKLLPLYSIGEANAHGNRLFQIIDASQILFKPSRNSKYILSLKNVGRNRINQLVQLIEIQKNCKTAITFKLDNEFVYITFDYNVLETHDYFVKRDRVIAIDLNPNSIGWSVVDWSDSNSYNLIQSGTVSLKPLNDFRNSLRVSSQDSRSKYVTNKRNYELTDIAKKLFSLCKYYHCETFVIEELTIPSKDNKKGRRYNRLVNNMWNRNFFIQQLAKRVYSSPTTLVEVQPQWNSYIGNLIFRKEKLPDECLASIEIGRRGWEFSTQYIYKRRSQNKTVVYPDLKLVQDVLAQSLEELNIDISNLDDWMNILQAVKKSEVKYRFSSSEAQKQHSERLFSKFYKKKYEFIFEYI